MHSKQLRLLILISASLSYGSTQIVMADGIAAGDLGLVKKDVSALPTPTPYHYSDQFPGMSQLLPRSYSGAPPQIPHNIETFIPITSSNNLCKGCHDMPDNIGKPRVKGNATPIPNSHYIDLRNGGKKSKQLIGARTVCTQCHVPQANVAPLVDNTFTNK